MILISAGDILLMGHPLKPGRALIFIFLQPILPPASHFLLMATESHCGTDKITASHWKFPQPGGRAQHFLPSFGTLREPLSPLDSRGKPNFSTSPLDLQRETAPCTGALLQLNHICHCRRMQPPFNQTATNALPDGV